MPIPRLRSALLCTMVAEGFVVYSGAFVVRPVLLRPAGAALEPRSVRLVNVPLKIVVESVLQNARLSA